ncbi:MAG: hypothetical protein K0B52_04965 [FCB group bacterium]|nr:hypothetical protein [FCB group bacterium]
MKRSKMMTGMLIISLLFAGLLFANDVTCIAVHLGNPEYASVVIREEYPGFRFYTTDGSCFRYFDNSSRLGNPNFLSGLYGEVPEKMGLSPNYGFGLPKIMIVGANGIIAAHSTSHLFYDALLGFDDDYGGTQSSDYGKSMRALTKTFNDVKKGKYAKALPESKRVYLKSTPVGELEPYRGAKTDKKGDGLVGWEIPDVPVYDDEGNEHRLNELCKDKNVMLVFYSMNGMRMKNSSKQDGAVIEKEEYAAKPKRPDKTRAQMLEEAESLGKLAQALAKRSAMAPRSGDYGKGVAVLEVAKSLLEGK